MATNKKFVDMYACLKKAGMKGQAIKTMNPDDLSRICGWSPDDWIALREHMFNPPKKEVQTPVIVQEKAQDPTPAAAVVLRPGNCGLRLTGSEILCSKCACRIHVTFHAFEVTGGECFAYCSKCSDEKWGGMSSEFKFFTAEGVESLVAASVAEVEAEKTKGILAPDPDVTANPAGSALKNSPVGLWTSYCDGIVSDIVDGTGPVLAAWIKERTGRGREFKKESIIIDRPMSVQMMAYVVKQLSSAGWMNVRIDPVPRGYMVTMNLNPGWREPSIYNPEAK